MVSIGSFNLISGFVYMLAKGYMVYGDKKYLDSALRCGEVTWEKGLLTKGPGEQLLIFAHHIALT